MPLRTNDIIRGCRRNLLITYDKPLRTIATVGSVLASFNRLMRKREPTSKMMCILCDDIQWVGELHEKHKHIARGAYVSGARLHDEVVKQQNIKNINLDILEVYQWLEMQEVYVVNASQYVRINKQIAQSDQ